MLSVVHLQTEPDGKPDEEVGILLIDKLLTNVAQHLSLVILSPTMNEQLQQAQLL